MPNERNPSGTETQKSGRGPGRSQDKWQGQQGQDENAIDGGDDNVEIGDPVPEKDRTPRASRDRQGLSAGQGETGEDEGLSGDAGDGDRH